MMSGKNKEMLLNTLIGILGCFFVIVVHQIGYELYMSYFTPRSRGVSLGFVMLYMRCIIIPVVFISSFIKIKHSLIITSVAIIYMIYSWCETNPLRVALMFFSYSAGYVAVIISSAIKNKFTKNTQPNLTRTG